jgi:hypothetical protein
LSQLEGDEYSFAPVKYELQYTFPFVVGIIFNLMGRDILPLAVGIKTNNNVQSVPLHIGLNTKETGMQGQFIMHCKSTRTILRVGLGSIMSHKPIYAIIKIVDCNCR